MVQEQHAKIAFFALIGIAVVLEVIADVLFKKWALENKDTLLLIGLAFYFVGTVFWAFSLRQELLSKAISVFTVLNLIMVILVGVLYFKEDITGLNKAGIFLGVISVILMEL